MSDAGKDSVCVCEEVFCLYTVTINIKLVRFQSADFKLGSMLVQLSGDLQGFQLSTLMAQ